jgi:amino acid adenylation domain-containing protein
MAWHGIEYLAGEERTNYPLTFSVDDLGDDFMLVAQVDERIEPECVCDMMHVALEELVAAVDRDSALDELDVMPRVVRDRQLVERNATSAPYARDACIHELFAARAVLSPEAIAVSDQTRALTYAELHAHANRLAHQLRAIGVRPGSRVAICVERSVEMVIGLLAILEAGGAYVPLDPAYPLERLELMLADSAPDVMLTLGARAEAVRDGLKRARAGLHVIDLRDILRAPAGAPTAIHGGPTSEDAAYVVYTSGSTGRPKGVIGSHRSAVNRFDWMWRSYPFTADDVCCQKTALSFIDATWEVFGPLLRGVPLHIIDQQTVLDPRRLVAVLAERHVTRIVVVPSLLRAILDTDAELSTRLCKLRLCVTSGEALSSDLAARFLAQLPGTRLLNLYGSSEVAADSTFHEVTRADAEAQSIPIGRPIANTQIYLLDQRVRPVPRGAIGELHIGGDGVALGYLGRPDATAERFIPNPFGPGRLFRSGDLARYLPNGDLEYLGRNDFQVKIRGFRVELPEIETRLREAPGVASVVVVSRADERGQPKLVAYFTMHDRVAGEHGAREAMRTHLLQSLPEYMVPAAYVLLDQLPLTPSGKIDRNALPSPGRDASSVRGYAAPETRTEQLIARLWSELLGVEPVGRYDSFFELGGHSLLATQVASRLESELRIRVELETLFSAPFLKDLAARIDELARRNRDLIAQIPRTQERVAQARAILADPLASPAAKIGAQRFLEGFDGV